MKQGKQSMLVDGQRGEREIQSLLSRFLQQVSPTHEFYLKSGVLSNSLPMGMDIGS